MDKQPSDEFVDDVARRWGQINIFDIRRRAAAKRRGAEPSTSSRTWRVIAVLSLFAGLAAAWSDIAGGARGDVIATKWLVASGVTYFLLIRLTAALLWTATISAIAGLAGLGWKALGWYETGNWLPWRMGDLFVSDLVSAPGWFLETDAVAGFLVLAIAAGSAGLALRQLQMRKHPTAD